MFMFLMVVLLLSLNVFASDLEIKGRDVDLQRENVRLKMYDVVDYSENNVLIEKDLISVNSRSMDIRGKDVRIKEKEKKP